MMKGCGNRTMEDGLLFVRTVVQKSGGQRNKAGDVASCTEETLTQKLPKGMCTQQPVLSPSLLTLQLAPHLSWSHAQLLRAPRRPASKVQDLSWSVTGACAGFHCQFGCSDQGHRGYKKMKPVERHEILFCNFTWILSVKIICYCIVYLMNLFLIISCTWLKILETLLACSSQDY